MATVGACTRVEQTFDSIKAITWTWTCDSLGAGSGDDFTTTAKFTGRIILLATDPGATAPADNYDIVINDSSGFDILAGAGQNRDTANTEFVAEASLGAVVASTLQLVIASAGDTKQGVVKIWLR